MTTPLGQNKDHIGGNFQWEIPPKCSCGMFRKAIDEDKFIFVSNFTDGRWNTFYIMPLAADGGLARSDGIPISNCPWCGDKIKARKLYPSED